MSRIYGQWIMDMRVTGISANIIYYIVIVYREERGDLVLVFCFLLVRWAEFELAITWLLLFWFLGHKG